ncbi:MAG: hypothetical protein U0Q18_37000 [Bryobacteraceae bacterium]
MKRLLPCKGGPDVFALALREAKPGDRFVLAFDAETRQFAEYTHFSRKQRHEYRRTLRRYERMVEIGRVLELKVTDACPGDPEGSWC